MAQVRPPSPYKVVPIPAGYRRATPKEITPKVQRAAVRALQQALPIGKMQATEVDGKLYTFVTEGHYDDHVTQPGKPIWHPGISTLVPTVQPKTGSAAASDKLYAQAQAIKSKKGKVAGDEFGDDVHFTGDFGDDPTEEDLESTYAADELYDAVHGDDFGDDDFGDEFGASRRKGRAKAKAKANVSVKVKGKVSVGKKPARKGPAARKAAARRGPGVRKAVARPAVTPQKVATPAITPQKVPTSARTTPTSTDSPLGPSAPFDDTAIMPLDMGPQAAEPQEASPEVEAAMDNYAEGGEETPETADEGSDTYDASAVNGENLTHDRFSVGA
jgi:hypothetical protein